MLLQETEFYIIRIGIFYIPITGIIRVQNFAFVPGFVIMLIAKLYCWLNKIVLVLSS